jgi:Leucine-rich repeat (LRR) protein
MNITERQDMSRTEAVRRIEQAIEEQLTKLDLSGLELKEVPPEIGKCTHLIDLDLSKNQITSIPEAIGLMSNIKWLNLNSNQITSIPPAIGQMSSLIGLNLDNNQITSIPKEIEHLSNLDCLLLKGNKITLIPKKAIEQLSNLKLTWLDISRNPVIKVSITPGSSGFPPKLGQLEKLQVVNGVIEDGTYNHRDYQRPKQPKWSYRG